MPQSLFQSGSNACPLASDLLTLGKLVRGRRIACELTLLDTADCLNVSVDVVSHIEDGRPVDTGSLFKVLRGLGLELLVVSASDAIGALSALGHIYRPDRMTIRRSHDESLNLTTSLVLDNVTPTVFLDFDGTLHVGHSFLGEDGEITLDTGRPLLEFASLLADLLVPYPDVEIVLTTSWVKTLPVGKVISCLPAELVRRVVATTRDIKARFGNLRNGTDRTYVIVSFAYGRRLKTWLALDDSAYGIEQFGRYPGELAEHFVLLDSSCGINDAKVLRRISEWLERAHNDHER